MPPPRTIAVWCQDWPVVAACAVDGVPPDKPAAVISANRVLACSGQARAEGVRRGLRKREAQARCADLVVLPADLDRDARVFEPVVCAVEALAPGVEIVRPGLLVLAARGPVNYFGSELAVAERIVDQVGALAGVECQVGIADGIFAATLAAHQGVLVHEGATPEFLAPQDMRALLHADESTPTTTRARAAQQGREDFVGLLRRLGLPTLGAFAALPVRDVASRFGSDAVVAHRLASGHDDRLVARRPPPVDLAVERRFDPPVDRVDAAAFAAREPAARLHELLADRGLACTRLQVCAETENGEELARTWRCADPLTPSGINDRVRWQLDAWITAAAIERGRGEDGVVDGGRPRGRRPGGPTAGIVLLRLVPDEVTPVGMLQRGLWGDSDGEGGEQTARAARALVRVQGMLGPESVFTGVLAGGRDPAQRVTLVPWGDERVPARPPGEPWPGQLPAPSPATIAAPGERSAEVVDAAGVPVGVTARAVLTAQPCRVTVDGRAHDVVGWAGPWPIEERWWEPDGGRRRARLQVAVHDGPALLLTCENGRWHVEGVYD